jgi:HAMP domain-containing protein
VPSQRKLEIAAVQNLVIAGWTGRNTAALEAHIKELEAVGVKRPKSVPIFYRVAASLLTTAGSIEAMADKSSGEVEFVLYALDDGLWVGVGSDHTDRKAETIGVTLSKQMCAKPVGATLWRYDEVRPHWDKLTLRSYVSEGGARRLYQEGPVTNMRSPEELIRLYTGGDRLAPGTAMFCGTFAVHGGLCYGGTFEMELDDPVLGRKLTHNYKIVSLPDEG